MSTFEKDNGLNLEATELRLGLPGCDGASPSPRGINKRALPVDAATEATVSSDVEKKNTQPMKAQVVGWPPVRSYRKSCMEAAKKTSEGAFVKVCMDGAPYLRKMDLKLYKAYSELLKALEDMFSFKAGGYTDSRGYDGADFVPTYEDKDGDWMLLGDVPWEMFVSSCKRLRIMKGSEAKGLAL